MAMEGKIFGTDGIRGRFGEGWLTQERVSALGRAVARANVNGKGETRRALVAHDGRASGPLLEQAIASGLSAEGVASVSAGLLTTPGLAWLTQTGDYDLGIMISASHNPAADNGVKVFSASGEKLVDEVEDRVEELLWADDSGSESSGEVPFDPALAEAYTTYLRERACPDLDLSGMRVALDCANGAGSYVAPATLEGLGATVTSIHCAPNGENINAGCGSTHPGDLAPRGTSPGAPTRIVLCAPRFGNSFGCALSQPHPAIAVPPRAARG